MKNVLQRFRNIYSPTQLKKSLKQFLNSSIYSFVFIFFTFLWLLLLSSIDSLFIIRTIQTDGPEEVKNIIGASQLYGKRSWMLKKEEIRDSLEKMNPKYKIRDVMIRYPDSLIFSVQRFFPSVYLKISEGFLLLSKEGRILEKSKEQKASQYPIITFYESIPYLQHEAGYFFTNKDLLDSIYFKYVVEQSKEKVNSIDIAGYHVLRLYTKDHEYLFSSDRERSIQEYQFNKAVLEFRINGTSFIKLDFRYEKPVVTF